MSDKHGTAHCGTFQNEGWLHYLEVCWMGEHHLLIDIEIQKIRPTNHYSTEIITSSFNFHLQKLSGKLISGLCQCQHTYDIHFCQAPWCFLSISPLWHETWQVLQLVIFSRGYRKETDWHTEHTDFSLCWFSKLGWSHSSKGSEDEAALF